MKSARRKMNSGVTLLEIMVVLAIIVLIAGLAAPRLMDSFGRAKGKAADIQLTNLRGAVQMYYIDVGRYPSEAEGLSALLVAPANAASWRGPYLDDRDGTKDPWGREFLYRSPADTKPYEILTYGRDGRTGGSNEDSDISR